jgi:fucose permease
MNKELNHKLLVVLAFGMMLVFGIVMNLRSPVNPLIKSDYNLAHSQLALVMVFYSLGGSIASFFGGFLIEKFGLKKVLWAGLVVAALGLLGVNWVANFYMLFSIMLVVGVGFGILNVSGNSLASRIFTEDKGRMMNLFHVFFGIGGVVASLYAAKVLNLGFGWEKTYVFMVVGLGVLFLFSTLCSLPQGEKKEDRGEAGDLIKKPTVIIFIVMFFFHVGAEVGLGSWLGVYLDEVQGRSPEEISFYVFWYFAFFSVGRFLASRIVEKVGYLKLVLITSGAAIITILAGLIGPASFAFSFSLTGLVISINFPTMQASMFEVFNKNVSPIVGLTLMAGGLGNVFLGNWLAGLVNDLVGIELGFGIFILYLLVLISVTFYLKLKHLGEKVMLDSRL